MIAPCQPEQLEAFARGQLPPAEADAVRAHLGACEGCARELAWLRTERELLQARARAKEPHPVHAAMLRRSLEARLARERPAPNRLWRDRAPFAGRAMLSAFAAVLLAFVTASLPSGNSGVSIGIAQAAGSSCVSMEVAGFCPPPSEPQELMAAVEDQFDACLVATPRTGPGANELCW